METNELMGEQLIEEFSFNSVIAKHFYFRK